MNGKNHLCNARIGLLEGDGDERERLAEAVRDFNAALAEYPSWPVGLQVRADVLRARLPSVPRSREAVALKDDGTIRELSNELWRFCEVAEPCPWDGPAAAVRGVEHLRVARQELADRGHGIRERLSAAARQFWLAVLQAESWPAGLRERAEALSARVCPSGRVDQAVVRMGDRTAAEISREMLGLCDEAEAAEKPAT